MIDALGWPNDLALGDVGEGDTAMTTSPPPASPSPSPASRVSRSRLLIGAVGLVVLASLAAVTLTSPSTTVTRRGARPAGPPDTAAANTAANSEPNSVAAPRAEGHDVSPPLRTIAPHSTPEADADGGEVEREGDTRLDVLPHPATGAVDPVAQRAPVVKAGVVAPRAATVGAGFDGPGNGNMTVRSAPPDPNSAVGQTAIFTVVNSSFMIQSKTGVTTYGPTASNTIFSGFGGLCETTNDGDAVVRYDRLAGVWVFTQFANAGSSTGPYLECVAVSTSNDPTGTWNRYSYSFASFPDYPKLSVWPDAYYISYNLFSTSGAWAGPKVCALDRAKMLLGQAATQQCFSGSLSYGGLLPADLDGSVPPPAGEPNYVVALGATNTTLAAWKFHVDWVTPANSTFVQQPNLTVAAYSPACNGRTCIAQPGTTTLLDSLADRLMFRLAYRNFGSYASMVVTHAVTSGSIGVRWYELRSTAGTLSVFQQGTYVPDTRSRWMSSAAMDMSGNMAIGYSVTGSTTKPSLAATGRLAADALGTLTQGESMLVTGGGVQTGTLTRWGDYASMNIDPADDCTFWFTGEYLPASGSFNWRTRVASLKFAGCGGPIVPDFVVTATPASATVSPGGNSTVAVSTTTTSGIAQSVALSATGLPTDASASFSPASLNSGAGSVLTITTLGTTPTGSYPITITATGASATHTTTITLVVSLPDFVMSAQPNPVSTSLGTSAGVVISTTAVGTPQAIGLSASALPSGATATFSPTSVTAGGASTLTIATTTLTPKGTYNITVTGTGTAATHSIPVTLTITATNIVVNGGFESGSLSGWIASGTNQAVTSPHSGLWAGQSGAVVATSGDSKITQTFTVPTGATKLTFWYRVSCPDRVSYDWATATLLDVKARTTKTVLAKTCNNTGTWVQVTTAVTAGRSYTLTLISHDDNIAADPTFTRFDDIVVS